MNSKADGEKIRILCVDDEVNVLRSLQRLFLDEDYDILTANSADEGLSILKGEGLIQLVISDYRMPGMNGVDFLKEVYRSWPDTIRIVLSGYADTSAVVSAINEGQIYKFIPKPWNDDELKVTVTNAIERYMLYKENLQLNEKLKKSNEELAILNRNLEELIDETVPELIFQNTVLTFTKTVLDALPVGVLGLDSEGRIVLCNAYCSTLIPGALEMIGLPRQEALPEDMNALIERVIEKTAGAGCVNINNRPVTVKGIRMKHSDGQEGISLVLDWENISA